ncbi:MAG: hypothetical protein ACYC9O_18660 [Candidatus Latescibacterota bacterium]
MKEKTPVSEEKMQSRRDILKKAGKTSAFVLPTIATFAMTDLKVAASGSRPPNPDDMLP